MAADDSRKTGDWQRSPEAQQILERLADCRHLAGEVYGLDVERFLRDLNRLTNLVLRQAR